jgi:hypothetical protein
VPIVDVDRTTLVVEPDSGRQPTRVTDRNACYTSLFCGSSVKISSSLAIASFLVSLGVDTQKSDGCTNGAHIEKGKHGEATQGEAASLHRFVHYLCGGGVRLD